jgi:hypothetical protein
MKSSVPRCNLPEISDHPHRSTHAMANTCRSNLLVKNAFISRYSCMNRNMKLASLIWFVTYCATYAHSQTYTQNSTAGSSNPCVPVVLNAAACSRQGAYMITQLSPLFCPQGHTFAPDGIDSSCPKGLPSQSMGSPACKSGAVPLSCSDRSKAIANIPDFCGANMYAGPHRLRQQCLPARRHFGRRWW